MKKEKKWRFKLIKKNKFKNILNLKKKSKIKRIKTKFDILIN
jgi:hypothetical protein